MARSSTPATQHTLTFAKGQLPAGQRILVCHQYDGKEPAADRKPDQPLPHQLPHAVRNEEKPDGSLTM